MIELGMIFALGFLVACLLSLAMLPVLSRRARRIATQRLQLMAPPSMVEVAAERDHLRAEHATVVRRLEQKIEAQGERLALAMSENGRQATALVAATDAHRSTLSDNAALSAELRDTSHAMIEAQGTLGAQMGLLHDSIGLAERRLALLNDTTARLAAALAVIDEQRATIAGLETRGTGQDLRLRAALAQSARLIERLDVATEQADRHAGERDIARADVALLKARRDELQARLDTLPTELSELRAEVGTQRAVIAQREHRVETTIDAIDRLTSRVAQQDIELAAANRSLREAVAQRDAMTADRDRWAARPAQETVPPARTDTDDEAPSPRSSRPEDFAALRTTISALAADLVRHARLSSGGDVPKAGP